jgi:Flp pilus assembly pilin Flp
MRCSSDRAEVRDVRRWLSDRVRGESGLAVIEYALLVALMTVPALKATEYVMNESSAVMDRNVGGLQTGEQNLDPPNVGGQEEDGDGEVEEEIDEGGDGGDSGGSDGSGGDETPTTTAAPTTTTTLAPTSSTVSIGNITTQRYSSSDRGYWRLRYVDVSLLNSAGQGVSGATVTIRITADTGTTVEINCVTSSSTPVGRCTAEQAKDKKFRTGGNNEVDWVNVQVVSVSGGTPAWTGPAPAATRVYQP